MSFLQEKKKKWQGKTRVHLMKMSLKHNGKFVSLLEFAHKRNTTTFLVIPKGLKDID